MHLSIVQEFSVWVLPVIFAITMPEAIQAYVAYFLGDQTAKQAGRLSLNPLRHVDPVGTVLLPTAGLLLGGAMFGWAKPIPIDVRAMRHPRVDIALISIAAPLVALVLMTLSLALIYAAVLLPEMVRDWAVKNLLNSADLNVILAMFRLLPVPPLPGGRVVAALLPRRLGDVFLRIEPFGMVIILGLFFIAPLALQSLGPGYSPFYWLVAMPGLWIEGHVAALLGIGA